MWMHECCGKGPRNCVDYIHPSLRQQAVRHSILSVIDYVPERWAFGHFVQRLAVMAGVAGEFTEGHGELLVGVMHIVTKRPPARSVDPLTLFLGEYARKWRGPSGDSPDTRLTIVPFTPKQPG